VKKDDELLFRKPKDNVEAFLKDKMLKKRLEESESRHDMTFKRLKSFVPWEIIIGVAALVAIYYLYGWKRILEAVLIYVMGTTLVAALLTSILSKYFSGRKKEKR
jgi:uncharacterized membrane protein YraQ (UPF0718 family)